MGTMAEHAGVFIWWKKKTSLKQLSWFLHVCQGGSNRGQKREMGFCENSNLKNVINCKICHLDK